MRKSGFLRKHPWTLPCERKPRESRKRNLKKKLEKRRSNKKKRPRRL